MSGFAVSTREVSVHFGDTRAVDRVSIDIEQNAIHGLLGRNGSGKTTLLSVIAALRQPTSGAVLVDGEDPFENERVMSGMCIVRESGDVMTDEKISANLSYFATVRRNWDGEYAAQLLDAFGLDAKKRPGRLSRGQKSAFGVVIGLASRAPLTIFDEVYLGMDAPSRYRFYDLLLADYVEHPRTFILSSHLISEIEKLFSGVTILDSGKLHLSEDAEDLRAQGATITGPAEQVDALTADLTVIGSQVLGTTRQVTVFGDLDRDFRQRVRGAGLDLGAVPLQDLFVHLTNQEDR